MKRIISSFLLVAVLTVSLVACGSQTASGSATTESAMEALGDDASPAQIVIADFTDKVNSGEFASLEELATALSEAEYYPYAMATMPVEPGYLNGFSHEIEGFTVGHMVSPMIGAIPFVAYVFEVDGDVDAFAKTLTDSADLGWNICTFADEMLYSVNGNKVCIVMAPASFDEE